MSEKKWSFVKKTFNTLGIAKVVGPRHDSGNSGDHREDDAIDDNQEDTEGQGKAKTTGHKKKKKHSRKSCGDLSGSKLQRDERAEVKQKKREERKKRSREDLYICKALGMDGEGMCLRHPNQPITTLGQTFEEVHLCRICDSESQVGNRAPKQRKSMAGVIDQVKQMQANRKDWRMRTKVMFWSSKQALEFDNNSSDDEALVAELAITQEEWEEQVAARVTQVAAWQDENQLQAHPIFSRYFKMMSMGVPVEAAKNACECDGYSSIVLDLDPAKSLKSQLGKFDEATRKELEEFVIAFQNEDEEELLEVPEVVRRVRTSFNSFKSREMLEAVHKLDALEEKAKRKKEAEQPGSEGYKSKKSESKTKGKETKSKKRRDSDGNGQKKKKSTSGDQKHNGLKGSTKEQRMACGKTGFDAIDESCGNVADDEQCLRARIEELTLALKQKDEEIAMLTGKLHQKDLVIEKLSKHEATVEKLN